MKIDSKTRICCIIGNPVEHSLSPQMHNAAYEELGLNYVFVASNVTNVKVAVAGIRGLNIAGVSVTIPHKQTVIQYLDEIDEVAKQIGAVNTIVNKNGKLYGTNTDWLGIIEPLKKTTIIKNKKVAVIGAGGAARAAIYGLKKEGCIISVFNRTFKNGDNLSQEFGLSGSYVLEAVDLIRQSDIIINATSVGMEGDISPISKKCFNKNQIVFDIVYTPSETRFLKDAKESGARIIHGSEMLLECVIRQFELFCGVKAPMEAMKNAMIKNLK